VGELVYDPSARAEELSGVVAKIFQDYPVEVATHN